MDEIRYLHKPGSAKSSEHTAYNTDDENNSSSDDENSIKHRNKNNNQPFWKEMLRQEERLFDKEALKKLNSKIDFLPNPRHAAARLAFKKDDLALNPPEKVFEITPKVLFFEKYVIGKVYEASFEVRNISKIAHQFKALPPKTHYFCLSLGMYPQGQSVIAPGLCAVFNVRFAPDSLCTFDDEILIECSNGSKLILPLIAKRESPCLSSINKINQIEPTI